MLNKVVDRSLFEMAGTTDGAVSPLVQELISQFARRISRYCRALDTGNTYLAAYSEHILNSREYQPVLLNRILNMFYIRRHVKNNSRRIILIIIVVLPAQKSKTTHVSTFKSKVNQAIKVKRRRAQEFR